MAKYLVTGAAGFIGSHLCDRLLELGHTVIGLDNKKIKHLGYQNNSNPNFTFINCDLTKHFDGAIYDNIDMVFHLAANADVRHGFEDTKRDLEHNTIATYNVLELMRRANINKIAFSSTSAIYGDIGKQYFPKPIPENCQIPTQISLYGASKLACEGLIQAYCSGFGMQSWIFRFSSIIGERYSHGFIYDFYRQLKKDPTKLYVVGGKDQQKSYLYVKDCVEGILHAINSDWTFSHGIYNLGHNDAVSLTDTIPIITRYLGINPEVTWSGNPVGWKGDSKYSFVDTSRIKGFGWHPTVSISEGIILTLKWLQENEWILEQRGDL
jgi:UDP-glucose 4-epimerase